MVLVGGLLVFACLCAPASGCQCLVVLPRNPEPFLVSSFTLMCHVFLCVPRLELHRRRPFFIAVFLGPDPRPRRGCSSWLCWLRLCVVLGVVSRSGRSGCFGFGLIKTLRPVATRIPTPALSLTVLMEVGRCSSGRACCGAALRKASMQPEKGPFKEYSSLVVYRGLFFRVHAVCRSANT